MANVPLKSVKFPGLPDTYTVPQIDANLTASGKAADAKVTGDSFNEFVEVAATPSSNKVHILVSPDSSTIDLATQDEVDEIKNEIDDIKSGLVEIPIDWAFNSGFPTGWRNGYYVSTVGQAVSINNSYNYIRALFIIQPSRYPALNNAKHIEVVPPAGYTVRLTEVDSTETVIRYVGEINAQNYPELVGKPVKLNYIEGMRYYVALGRFNSDAETYAADPTFIGQIKLRFYYDDTKLPKTHTSDYEWFFVSVDRPLAFGGEESNSTKENVEAVLRLPSSYDPFGDPVPLVLMCHGASGYVSKSAETWYNASWKAFCDELLTAGFALFDVNVLPTSAGTAEMGYTVGSPLAVNVAKNAYDYIIANYNVQQKILVHGTSMGGVLASAFVKAYPQICLAQSSFAGRDLTQYISQMSAGTLDNSDIFAHAYGYSNYSALVSDKFSHAEGLVPSLSIKKYTNGVATLPPLRDTDYQNWLAYYGNIQTYNKTDAVGDYTAFRSVPYKSWNSWADNANKTKAEEILAKAYTAGGSAPYLCVFYDSGTHTEMSYGQINNMIPQLIAWFKRWL